MHHTLTSCKGLCRASLTTLNNVLKKQFLGRLFRVCGCDSKEETTGVPWWLSGLKIWCCFCCGAGSIPSLGTSACLGCGQRKRKRKKRERKRQAPPLPCLYFHVGTENGKHSGQGAPLFFALTGSASPLQAEPGWPRAGRRCPVCPWQFHSLVCLNPSSTSFPGGTDLAESNSSPLKTLPWLALAGQGGR